jgi:hypothetical protein
VKGKKNTVKAAKRPNGEAVPRFAIIGCKKNGLV